MLDALLNLLRSGETLSLPEIARRLQTSEALAGMMLAELARMGMLETLEGCENEACACCASKNACHVGSQAKIWGSNVRIRPQTAAGRT